MIEDFFKYNRAYYVRFKNLDSEKYDAYLKKYLFPNFNQILDEDFENSVAIEEDENGNDNMVIFLDDIKIKQFIDFCNNECIVEEHYDIGTALLQGDEQMIVIKNMIEGDEFGHLFYRFMKQNLTIEIVLDKISKYGAESLTELDKKVLNNG